MSTNTREGALMQHTDLDHAVLHEAILHYMRHALLSAGAFGPQATAWMLAVACIPYTRQETQSHPKKGLRFTFVQRPLRPYLQALGVFGRCQVVSQGLNRHQRGRSSGSYDTSHQRHQ